jgi:protein O-mannosyl-transferase
METLEVVEQAPEQQIEEFHSSEVPKKHTLILCLLLALATIAIYSSILHAPFLNYDDSVYVTDNAQVRAGLTWQTIVWAFRTPAALDWHPITWLSYLVDAQIFGINAAGFHLVNVLIHAANAVLLFLILESVTGLAWRSLAVAALFALHPINVESVAWIAERKTVVSMFFFLIALAVYGWYARRPGLGRYLAVTGAFVLALMSKAQVITFPFAVLLLDYWPLRRLDLPSRSRSEGSEAGSSTAGGGWCFLKLILEKVPWVALSMVSAVITMRTGGGAFNYMLPPDASRSYLPWSMRLGSIAICYIKYLQKAVWPNNLALVYPHPGWAINMRVVAVSTVVLVALTTLAVVFRAKRPFFVGWFWFVGTLVPMSGVIPIGIHSMADRYAYIPLLGIFVIFSWGAAALIEKWHIPTRVAAAGAAIVFLMLGFALHRQVGYWGNNVTLWSHTLELTDANFTAEDNVATALISEGRIEEAIPHLLRASDLRPDDPLAAINIATYAQMHGNYRAAVNGYAKVLRLTHSPSLLVMARTNGGYAHYSLQEYDGAKVDFEAAVQLQPGNFLAYRGLGLVAQKSGNLKDAIRDYERTVQLAPIPSNFLFLAQGFELDGQNEAARAAHAQAARINPDLSDDYATVKHFISN